MSHQHDDRPTAINTSVGGGAASPSASSPYFAIETRTYKWRFVVLGLYVCFGILNQLQYVTYANIVRQVESHFNTTALGVNMLAATYAVIFCTFVFPGAEVYDRLGLRWGMIIGTSCNACGSLVKVVAILFFPNYWMLLFAQALNGVAQVFFLALPPLLSATWFPKDERGLATAIGTVSGFLGMAVGFMYPPLIVNKNHQDKAAFLALFISQAVPCCLVFLGTLFGVPKEPAVPPSVTSPQAVKLHKSMSATYEQSQRSTPATGVAVADEQSNLISGDNKKENQEALSPSFEKAIGEEEEEKKVTVFMQVVNESKRNRGFTLLYIVFGIGAGSCTALSTVLAQLLEPYKITEDSAGNIIMVGILSGCVMCGVFGAFVDKKRIYKLPLIFLYGFLAFIITALLIFMPTVGKSNEKAFAPVAWILVILITSCLLPTLPVGMELAVELTYPLPEVAASSVCMWSNSAVSVLGTVACSLALGNNPSKQSGIFLMVGLLLLMCLCILLITFGVEEEKKRMAHERAQQAAHDEHHQQQQERQSNGVIDM